MHKLPTLYPFDHCHLFYVSFPVFQHMHAHLHHETISKSIPQHEQSVSCLNNSNNIENMNVAGVIKYTYIGPAKQVIMKQSLTR